MARSTVLPMAVLAILLVISGCLSGAPGGDTPSPTATDEELDWTVTAGEQPDPDKEVHLENRWNQSVEMRVIVVRERTNETVHDDWHHLEPGVETIAYNLSDANPDGIESFHIIVTARNTTENISIETNACYGDAYAEIQDDGNLFLFYAIC